MREPECIDRRRASPPRVKSLPQSSSRSPVRIVSAGGHLTATTMPLAEVRGRIAISGIFDLEPIRLNYLNEKLGLDTAEAERNSPARHLPAKAGELVVAYGTRELPELCRQSTEYGRRWTERGLPGHLLPVDGADHFTILDALARPEGALTRALLGCSAASRPPALT